MHLSKEALRLVSLSPLVFVSERGIFGASIHLRYENTICNGKESLEFSKNLISE